MRKLTTQLVRWSVQEPKRAGEIAGRMRRLSARSTLFDYDLAGTLTLRAERHLIDGRRGDALADLDEAIALHGRARRFRRTAWARLLAHTSRLRGVALSQLDRLEEALSAVDDAVTRHNVLTDVPARSEKDYLLAVRLRATVLWRLDRRVDAVRVAEQALHTTRSLATRGHRHDTTPLLQMLCEWLFRLERHDEGARYGEEAVRQLRTSRAAPAALANTLVNLGACLLADRPADSLTATDEAISLLEPLLDSEPERHEDILLVARRNRARAVRALGLGEEEVLGPYPLCANCRATNGGLVATRHRQVHVAVNGREACVDERLAEIMPKLWAVCATTCSCEHDDGESHGTDPARAYVTPAEGHVEAAAAVLIELGFAVERRGGDLRFQLDNRPA